VYGTDTLDDHVARATARARSHDLTLEHVQSNHEGDLVDAVHAARGRHAAIVVNAAAVTHYGWSLHDALAAFDGPVVELHISNPFAREAWRHTSVVSPVADVVICGAGGLGYDLAVDAAAGIVAQRQG
jgi:3-dehydroquinate dehydratase-2